MNDDSRLISVIVPVYNVQSYLSKCIDSIVNQTYQNLEIILVDDGSTDSCGSICDEYAKKDKRIKVFHNENQGLSGARNFGIERATGEYLSFVDSDDWIEREMLNTLVHEAENSKADIVAFGVYEEFPNRTVTVPANHMRLANSIDSVKALIKGYLRDGVWSKFYHKACFANIRFPYGHVYEEYATVYKLLLNSVTVVSIAKPLYHYRRKRKGAITQTQSMTNLYDYWRAHKLRYVYFTQDVRFNTDEEIMDRLQWYCAKAIARTWRWCYASPVHERNQYAFLLNEMQVFAANHFLLFGRNGWPLYLRFSIFMVRFNNTFVYALLYYLNHGYRRLMLLDTMLALYYSKK